MIPYCILVIEDDDDRAFMEQLFVDYHRLMYHEIFKLVHNQGSEPSGELYYNGLQESVPQLPAGFWASFHIRSAGVYGV